jgi:hypothetical protein
MHVLARQLFDPGIYSVMTSGAAIGVGWKLNFYTGGTTTRITTYNARVSGSANANPVISDANGRFDDIWIEENQTIKWILTDQNDVPKAVVDDKLITVATTTIDSSLNSFLAASAALPIANGGTAATSAANAATSLAVLPTAGGTMTGNIIRSGKGVHPYYNNASMTGGQIYIQAAGADPTANPGDVVFEY